MTSTTAQLRYRRQLRGFVIVWSGITFIFGAVAFIALYLNYGAIFPSGGQNGLRAAAALPDRDRTPTESAPTPTAFPTRQPQPTSPPVAVAQADPAQMTPTRLPVDDRRFHLGVQVQVSYDNMAQWLDVAGNQLSVRWVKQQVRWEDIETERGVYDWFLTDTYLLAAQERGLRVLVSLVTAPDWARPEGVNLDQHGPPADYADYAAFAVALLRRYPGMIHAIEVWNEQNLDREWTTTNGLRAEDYIGLLRTAYQAIKDEDPGVVVISGALAPTGLSDGVRAWDDFVYLDQLISAGLLNYADCIGAHHNGINVSPDYTWDAIPDDPTASYRGPFDNPHHSWSFRSTLATYASKIALAGGEQKLCVTEFGWPSAEGLSGVPEGFEFANDNTLEEQRDFTVRALEYMRSSDSVWLAILWNLNYGPQAGWAADNDNVPYSIIGPNFVFRPVFDAVRDWNRAYEAAQVSGS